MCQISFDFILKSEGGVEGLSSEDAHALMCVLEKASSSSVWVTGRGRGRKGRLLAAARRFALLNT